ncbi:MAG: single-stranded DNA-binding protein [Chloroflexi bacterium]|nr:MAG: single-stranded DNA-binding protein [Chloroflexota bacterium]
MYQRLILVGNLGRDPEMRYTPNGTAVTQLSAAGQLKEETAWWRVSVFGKQAETCNQYLSKGKKVLIEGTLAVDEKSGGPRVYQRKDGTYGASFEVRATTVRFLSAKGEASDNGGGGMASVSSIAGDSGSMGEEDLPF